MTDDHSWQQRLDDVYEMMHEMSLQTEPQAMVRAYGARVGKLLPADRRISLSRRGLQAPWYRITRYSGWEAEINPWTEPERLPLLKGGLLAEMIYSNRPYLVDELVVPPDDPAAPYLDGQRSLMAIPMLDTGEALNMVVSTRTEPFAFERAGFADTFWMANLFGRATHNLVLKEQVGAALATIDRELKMVSHIQRSLLPKQMPDIPGLSLAAHYQTSARAGGDYYDFFPLCAGKWGLLIADVSGHGTPAAVMMAITHSIAHLFPGESGNPGDLLQFVNGHLCQRYTSDIEAFVTAFYAIYDVDARTLLCASAGHHPPCLWKCRTQEIVATEQQGSFPLGLFSEAEYDTYVLPLEPGDRFVLYTDGITEAMNPDGEQFGVARLDALLARSCGAPSDVLLQRLTAAVDEFTGGAPPLDDRTVVIGTAS